MTVERSSGNVYADLGFADAEEMLQKSGLVAAIAEVIAAQGLDRATVAVRVGLAEEELARLLRGHHRAHGVERLLGMLTRLGQDVEMVVRPKPTEVRREARVTVAVAHPL